MRFMVFECEVGNFNGLEEESAGRAHLLICNSIYCPLTLPLFLTILSQFCCVPVWYFSLRAIMNLEI